MTAFDYIEGFLAFIGALIVIGAAWLGIALWVAAGKETPKP